MMDMGKAPIRDTRPENRFLKYRKIALALIAIPVCFWLVALLQACGKPIGGVKVAGGAPTVQVASASGARDVVIQVPQGGVLPTVKPGNGVPASGASCHAVADVKTSSGLILPGGALVKVSGYSKVRGGLIMTDYGWLAAGEFDCGVSLQAIEIPYVPSTSTLIPTGRAVVRPAVQVQVSTSTPVPTSVPQVIINMPYPGSSPTSAALVGQGVTRYGLGTDCWKFDVAGVKQIWMNGSIPVNGGSVVCGVTEFRVIVK